MILIYESIKSDVLKNKHIDWSVYFERIVEFFKGFVCRTYKWQQFLKLENPRGVLMGMKWKAKSRAYSIQARLLKDKIIGFTMITCQIQYL